MSYKEHHLWKARASEEWSPGEMEQMWIVPRLTRGPAGTVKLSCTCVRWCGGAWRLSRPAYPWSLVDGFFLCFLLVTMSLWLERSFFPLENPALSEKPAPALRPKISVDPLLWMCGWGDLMQLQNSLGRMKERITNSVKVTLNAVVWALLSDVAFRAWGLAFFHWQMLFDVS